MAKALFNTYQTSLIHSGTQWQKQYSKCRSKSLDSRDAVPVPKANVLQNRLKQDCKVGETWRSYLWQSIPWKEYTLYHTFCNDSGLSDQYHQCSELHLLRGQSVWHPKELEQWNPAEVFQPDTPYVFSVVQCNTEVSRNCLVFS
jgi:hypothetical protein